MCEKVTERKSERDRDQQRGRNRHGEIAKDKENFEKKISSTKRKRWLCFLARESNF